jgi:DNA-binding MarR family transcriptional regulator
LAARRATQFVEQRMAAVGVSFARFGLMAEIASASDDTVSALAERMGLDQSTLSRTLRTLEAEQLVEIATVESDQRKRMVWLTEKGARQLEAALVAWRLAQSELEQRLSVDLARQLAAEAATL